MVKMKPIPGMQIIGKIPTLGVTNYIRNGSVVTRKSNSDGRRSNSRKQFIQRQRMRHAMALWKELAHCQPMFTEGKTHYLGFISLANRMPAVFIPKRGPLSGATLLMPNIPVSGGTLQPIQQQLGEVDGTPALITSLKANNQRPFERFLLYTAEQQLYVDNDCPVVGFQVREVKYNEFTEMEGCLALVDDVFSDEMKGWALVHIIGQRCSTQGIVTRCTYYEQFTTEEALQNAAKSYGGLK